MNIVGIKVLLYCHIPIIYISTRTACILIHSYFCVVEANMLYLETPIGVGFSYAKGSSSYTTTVNDEETGIYHITSLLFIIKSFLRQKMFLFRNFL